MIFYFDFSLSLFQNVVIQYLLHATTLSLAIPIQCLPSDSYCHDVIFFFFPPITLCPLFLIAEHIQSIPNKDLQYVLKHPFSWPYTIISHFH